MTKFYAKTYKSHGDTKTESIEEHTEELLTNLKILSKLFRKDIEISYSTGSTIWEDLKIASIFHDLGKVSDAFQIKIKKSIGENIDGTILPLNEIPHNFLSPAFLYGLDDLKKDDYKRFRRILLAIAFHHDRILKTDDTSEQLFFNIIRNDLFFKAGLLTNWIGRFLKGYNPKKLSPEYFQTIKSFIEGNNRKLNTLKRDKDFILLKGLLHRLDYSASAHLPVETGRLGNPTPAIINYLKDKGFRLRTFQEEAENYREKSVILTASTGTGKTEFALNWLGDSKGYYTLPLKVSVNAMFKRLNKIFSNEKVGIIHSDSYALGIDDKKLTFDSEEASIEGNIQRVDISRQFAYPLIVTTADQLFTSVFKWPGYERIYATLMYSKIILDEPQSYSPKTLAMIIKGLEEISNYGGRFCYMSATHHPFILEKLKGVENVEFLEPVYNTELKHKIKLHEKGIDELEQEIISRFRLGKKVLVILNTVKKSQDLFKNLKDEVGESNIHLLHSGFIKKHRDEKEKNIQKDDRSEGRPVVWISTQIVEASLDIDYDVLFTEIATLDALIQRMGRVYRKVGRRIAESDLENVIIACEEPSDKGFIYNNEIVNFTHQELKKFNGKILTEFDKQEIMNAVFDINRLRGTRFLQQFEDAYQLLDLGFTTGKNEAQYLFREIDQVKAIPRNVYAENEDEIDELIVILKSKARRKEKIKASINLNQFLLSIPSYKKTKEGMERLPFTKKSDLYLIPAKYDDRLGLQYGEIENIF